MKIRKPLRWDDWELWAAGIVAVTIIMLALAPMAHAQAVLSCTGATQNTDGSAVSGPLQYTWHHGTSATSLPDKAAGLQACGYTWPNLSAATHYFAATNTDSLGRESALSAVVSWVGGTGGPVLPNPPTNITVDPTRLTAYGSQQTDEKQTVYPVGTVAADTTCDGTMSANGLYHVPKSSVTWAGSVRPKVVFAACVPSGG